MHRCAVIIVLIVGVSSNCRKCFPQDFLLGTATSAYQIEGGWNASGKGENIWDWFTHTHPEKIIGGANGDIAADSYHKYQEDVELLSDLGVDFYRFSISWARILPDGTTKNINQNGVDYYLNLLKALKAKNIEALVTLYHWELPLTLHELGGWTNPEMSNYFNDYATLCYELFGDYVKYWATINEPYIHCYASYGTGVHAPGYVQSGTLTYMCFYSLLLAHAKAYRTYNQTFKATQKGEVGMVVNTAWYQPLSESEEDKIAAEMALQWDLGIPAHPVLIGNWPQVVIDRIGTLSKAQGFNSSRLPSLTNDEIELIKGTYDYIGLNYYSTQYATPIANLSANLTVSYEVDRGAEFSINKTWIEAANDWLHDTPEGLRKSLNWIAKSYGNPRLIITENGWSDARETLNDTTRIDYLKGHLCSILKAKYMDGVNVLGYTYWSFLDSFEWSTGYTTEFGLIAVDFESENRTRTPKVSYSYYKDVIKTKCIDYCPYR